VSEEGKVRLDREDGSEGMRQYTLMNAAQDEAKKESIRRESSAVYVLWALTLALSGSAQPAHLNQKGTQKPRAMKSAQKEKVGRNSKHRLPLSLRASLPCLCHLIFALILLRLLTLPP